MAASPKPSFSFNSESLPLRSNPDYKALLKTLAMLEAQKIRAIADLEELHQVKEEVEHDPLAMLDALKSGDLASRLPQRQEVVELPPVDWGPYKEVLNALATHQSAYNTRKRKPQAIEEKPLTVKKKDHRKKPMSYGQAWSEEEQERLEELLRIYPPEEVEAKRWQKIANALGNRTAKQVCCRVQKYFIKLAKAGLPVPGRMPNLATYTRKRKSKKLVPQRPSTFFHSLKPRVYMVPEEGGSQSSSSSDDDNEEEGVGFVGALPTGVVGREGPSASRPAQATCTHCQQHLLGASWTCLECPTHSVRLCPECVNSSWQSRDHLPTHEMQQVDTSDGYVDEDYSTFSTSVGTHYNYLDPNFFPAS